LKKTFLFIALISLTACEDGAREEQKPTEELTQVKGEIDVRLSPYVDHFLDTAQEQERPVELPENLSVGIAQMDPGHNGKCMTSAVERRVLISEKLFFSNDYDKITYVVFHELGHCVLNRDHHNEMDTEHHRPQSVMHAHTMSGKQFMDGFEEYMAELFSVN